MMSRKNITSAVVGVVCAVVGTGTGYAVRSSQGSTASFELPSTPAVSSTLFPRSETNHVGSGPWHVPSEAPPGTYDLTSTSGTFGCSWWRLKKNDNKPKSEIASGTFSRGGFDTVVVLPTDKYFRLSGDCTWKLEAAPASKGE